MSMKFKEGDTVKIDNEVKCTVDGFYKEYVVVQLRWMQGVKGKFMGSGGKQAYVDTMLVHPDNLTPV
jgi:hypothetical protein